MYIFRFSFCILHFIMFEIIPSPGTEDKKWEDIERKIELVRPFAKTIHIDMVDGKFANNKTFADPEPFRRFTKDFVFELHLMVEDPLQYIPEWADVGFQRFIGQIEKMPDQAAFVAKAEEYGEVGLALNAKTPLDALKVSIADLDLLLFMTVNAGFSGQEFQPEQLEEIKKLVKPFDGFPIEVDGGINEETIVKAKQAGVTRFVVTSSLFDSEDPGGQFEKLSQVISSAL